MLKEMSSFIFVRVSVSLMIGTLALSRTFMVLGSAMLLSIRRRSRVRKGGADHSPNITMSISLGRVIDLILISSTACLLFKFI